MFRGFLDPMVTVDKTSVCFDEHKNICYKIIYIRTSKYVGNLKEHTSMYRVLE